VQGYSLSDEWTAHPGRKLYTHYTTHGTTRFDRFELSCDLLARKKGIETVAAAFTDHFAVVLPLTLDAPIVRRGRGTWKLNSYILSANHIIERIQQD
jgi:hypothetical protein